MPVLPHADPKVQRQEALEVQLLCGLTDAQTETLATLSETRYAKLYLAVAASGASPLAIRKFLDQCAREPQGILIRLPAKTLFLRENI